MNHMKLISKLIYAIANIKYDIMRKKEILNDGRSLLNVEVSVEVDVKTGIVTTGKILYQTSNIINISYCIYIFLNLELYDCACPLIIEG